MDDIQYCDELKRLAEEKDRALTQEEIDQLQREEDELAKEYYSYDNPDNPDYQDDQDDQENEDYDR